MKKKHLFLRGAVRTFLSLALATMMVPSVALTALADAVEEAGDAISIAATLSSGSGTTSATDGGTVSISYTTSSGTSTTDSLVTAFSSVESGGTITLNQNITFTGSTSKSVTNSSGTGGAYYIAVTKNVTLNLNGYTLSYSGSSARLFGIGEYTLTVNGGTSANDATADTVTDGTCDTTEKTVTAGSSSLGGIKDASADSHGLFLLLYGSGGLTLNGGSYTSVSTQNASLIKSRPVGGNNTTERNSSYSIALNFNYCVFDTAMPVLNADTYSTVAVTLNMTGGCVTQSTKFTKTSSFTGPMIYAQASHGGTWNLTGVTMYTQNLPCTGAYSSSTPINIENCTLITTAYYTVTTSSYGELNATNSTIQNLCSASYAAVQVHTSGGNITFENCTVSSPYEAIYATLSYDESATQVRFDSCQITGKVETYHSYDSENSTAYSGTMTDGGSFNSIWIYGSSTVDGSVICHNSVYGVTQVVLGADPDGNPSGSVEVTGDVSVESSGSATTNTVTTGSGRNQTKTSVAALNEALFTAYNATIKGNCTVSGTKNGATQLFLDACTVEGYVKAENKGSNLCTVMYLNGTEVQGTAASGDESGYSTYLKNSSTGELDYFVSTSSQAGAVYAENSSTGFLIAMATSDDDVTLEISSTAEPVVYDEDGNLVEVSSTGGLTIADADENEAEDEAVVNMTSLTVTDDTKSDNAGYIAVIIDGLNVSGAVSISSTSTSGLLEVSAADTTVGSITIEYNGGSGSQTSELGDGNTVSAGINIDGLTITTDDSATITLTYSGDGDLTISLSDITGNVEVVNSGSGTVAVTVKDTTIDGSVTVSTETGSTGSATLTVEGATITGDVTVSAVSDSTAELSASDSVISGDIELGNSGTITLGLTGCFVGGAVTTTVAYTADDTSVATTDEDGNSTVTGNTFGAAYSTWGTNSAISYWDSTYDGTTSTDSDTNFYNTSSTEWTSDGLYACYIGDNSEKADSEGTSADYTEYSFAAAIARCSADSADTIVFLTDSAPESGVSTTIYGSITIDLDGHNITAPRNLLDWEVGSVSIVNNGEGGGTISADSASYVFNVRSNASLTLGSGVTVTQTNTNTCSAGVIDCSNGQGTLVVDGATITTDCGDVVYFANGGTVTINSGKLSTSKTSAAAIKLSTASAGTAGTLTITGGTINGGGNGGSGVNLGGSADLTVSGGTIEGGDYGVKSTSTGAGSISGGTISGNYGVYAKGCNLTITGGTISGVAKGVFFWTANGTCTISGESTSISATGDDSNGLQVVSGTATVSGGTFSGVAAAAASTGSGTLNIQSGTFTGTKSGIEAYAGTVTISGGTISATAGAGILNNGSCAVTITSGSITGTTAGFSAESTGTVAISGGTIRGTAGPGILSTNGAGGSITISDGAITGSTAAIQASTSTFTISGGTLTGSSAAIQATGGSVTVTGGSLEATAEDGIGIWVPTSSTAHVHVSGGTIEAAYGVVQGAAPTVDTLGVADASSPCVCVAGGTWTTSEASVYTGSGSDYVNVWGGTFDAIVPSAYLQVSSCSEITEGSPSSESIIELALAITASEGDETTTYQVFTANDDAVDAINGALAETDLEALEVILCHGSLTYGEDCTDTATLEEGQLTFTVSSDEGQEPGSFTLYGQVITVGSVDACNLGHAYTYSCTESATCTTPAMGTYTCATCGDSYQVVAEVATGHVWPAAGDDGAYVNGNNVKVTAPTCTNYGYAKLTCTVDGCEATCITGFTNPTGHTYATYNAEAAEQATGVAYTAPTCTKMGTIVYTCTNGCGESYTEYVDALGHEYTMSVEAAATCTAPGTLKWSCTHSNCEDYYYEAIPTTEHDYTGEGAVETTEATCTTSGYTKYTCGTCGFSYISDFVVATGHNISTEIETEATCTTDGYMKYSCSDCNLEYYDTIAALGHAWGDGESTDATCQTQGTVKYSCTRENCSATYTDYAGYLNHVYSSAITTQATCTTAGVITFTCSTCEAHAAGCALAAESPADDATCTCGHSYTAAIPATGHSYVTTYYQAATCGKAGYIVSVCQNCSAHAEGCSNTSTEASAITTSCGGDCGMVTVVKIAALEHNYIGTVTTQPTCEDDGVITYICSYCGDYQHGTVEATDHVEYTTITKAPTCTEGGTQTTICLTCGETLKTVTYNATGDTTVSEAYTTYTDAAEAADEAYTAYQTAYAAWSAAVYNTSLYNAMTSASSAYSTAKAVKTAAYTAYTEALESYNTENAAIAPTGHTWSCVEATTTSHRCVCVSCGKVNTAWTANYTASDGGTTHTDYHYCKYCGEYVGSYETTSCEFEVTESQAATCTEDGFTTYTCTLCGYSYTDTIDAIGHNYVSKYATADCHVCQCANCGDIQVGYTSSKFGESYDRDSHFWVGYCSHCGTYFNGGEIVEAHDFVTETVEATCTTDGYTTYTCSVCGYSYTDAAVKASGHNYQTIATIANTCVADGYLIQKCANCGDIIGVTVEKSGVHTYVGVETTAATCMEDGVITYTCIYCGDIQHATIEATGHTSATYTVVDKAATCAENGYSTEHCLTCGAQVGEQTTIKATGHNYIGVVTTQPTCESAGITTYTCAYCGDTDTADDVEATGHVTYTTVTKQPTCTETGISTEQCLYCDYSNETELAVADHAYVRDTVEATCAKDGYVIISCSNCTYTRTVVLDATGEHNYVGAVTKVATCTEPGEMTYTCGVCGDSCTEEIAVIDHAAVTIPAVAPTCTAEGSTAGSYCAVCGETLVAVEAVKALGHTEETTTIEPTCTSAGVVTITCSKCLTILSVTTIKANGHTPGDAATCTENQICTVCDAILATATGHTVVTDEAVAATCEEPGLAAGSHCSVCSTVLTAQTEVAATGHNYIGAITKAATCSAEGETTYTCSYCSDSYAEAIEKTAHAAVTVAAVAPTCSIAGSTEGSYCAVCGEILVAVEAVEALGHTEVVDEAVAATCAATGLTEGSHCSTCGEVLLAQEVVGTTKHTEVTTTIEPTCTSAGVVTITCADCEAILSVTTTEANGHTLGAAATCTTNQICTVCEAILATATGHTVVTDEAVAATCDESGLTAGSHCSVCSAVLTAQTKVAATGHNYISAVKQAATCSTEGVIAYTCANCGDTQSETIEKTAHAAVAVAAVAPTCTNAGSTAGSYCAVCSEVLVAVETVEALGHTAVVDEAVAATCTTTGLKEGSHCSTCGEVLVAQEVEGTIKHVEETTVTVEPTCTTAGVETTICTECKTILAVTTIDANGHSSVKVEAVEATCTKAGTTAGTKCSVCNIVLSGCEATALASHTAGAEATCTTNQTCTDCGAILATATGHTVVTDAAVAATCTTTGLTAGSHCSVCNTVITAQTTVAATGHTVVAIPAVAATCTAAGSTAGSYCAVCNTTITAVETVNAKGHSYGDYVVTTAATCVSAGIQTATCSVCGTTKTEAIASTGHTYGDYEVTMAATCTTAGYATATCSACENTKTKVLAATGHAYGEYVETVASSCTAAGTKTATCANCGGTTSESIATTEHVYVSGICTECAATEEGYIFSQTVSLDSPVKISGKKGTTKRIVIGGDYVGVIKIKVGKQAKKYIKAYINASGKLVIKVKKNAKAGKIYNVKIRACATGNYAKSNIAKLKLRITE